jgi:hypothetical protein
MALAAAAGICVLACGAPARPGQPQSAGQASASVHDQAAPVWHRLVECARQNGMPDLPDPTIDDRGQAHFPNGDPSPPPSVQQACRAIYDQLPAQVRSDGQSAADVESLRKFAACRRDRGITDWPDPDPQGTFHLPPNLSGNLKQGPRWPQIQAAWNGPCRRYDTSGHIDVTQG